MNVTEEVTIYRPNVSTLLSNAHSENMLQSLKRFLSNFNVVAIQNSLDGFRNTLNVRNNSKTSRWFPFIKSVTMCNWFLAVIKRPLVAAFRSPLMKALDRSVETLGL